MKIVVRSVDPARDSEGIARVVRDEDYLPWAKPDSCLGELARAQARGIYQTVALADGMVAGFSVWNEDAERGEAFLYLSMLHVDMELRSRGIGAAILADAARHAGSAGISVLRTMPEGDRSLQFYRRNGFDVKDYLDGFRCATQAGAFAAEEIAAPSVDMIDGLEFVFGLSQASPRFMFHLCDSHIQALRGYPVRSFWLRGGLAHLRYPKGKIETAQVLYWSGAVPTKETLAELLALGHSLGFEALEFEYRRKYAGLFAGRENLWLGDNSEIVLEKNILL